MSLFRPAPEPLTKLGRYRILAPTAGLRVSPLVLGGGSIGSKWAALGAGQMDRESSFKLLDAFYDAGGNFIDTANNYQYEESEEIIGEWLEQRGIRDQMVIATKYTLVYKTNDEGVKQRISFVGNGSKSMRNSVEASLKKLRTSYIDVLYIHCWDDETSIEEIMNGLHNFVAQGKVLYLGVCNAPAWFVTKANAYARTNGKTPFSMYQGPWSIIERDFEREIIPMCRSEGMALVPWNVIGGGRLRSDAEETKREESGEGGRTFGRPDWRRTENEAKVSRALEKVGKEHGEGISVSAVAIAYVMHKAPYVFPIVGGRKVEHLHDNIKALSISLTPEQIEYLESQLPFDPGFPYKTFGDGTKPKSFIISAAHVDRVPIVAPITPSKN